MALKVARRAITIGNPLVIVCGRVNHQPIPRRVVEQDPEESKTVILDGAPHLSDSAPPEQIYVQASQPGLGGMPPATNATVALVLSIVGLVMCGLCTAIPGLILANGALANTNQYPNHPDAGVAKAAQVVGWVTIVIWVLIIVVYVAIFGFIGLAMWSEGA